MRREGRGSHLQKMTGSHIGHAIPVIDRAKVLLRAHPHHPSLSRREHVQHVSDISVLILFLEENMALLHRCFVHAPEHSHRV